MYKELSCILVVFLVKIKKKVGTQTQHILSSYNPFDKFLKTWI